MDKNLQVEIYAKLSTLEYLLECSFAQHLAVQPLDFQTQTICEIRRLSKQGYTSSSDSDSDFLLQIGVRSSEMTDRLLDKVEERAMQIHKEIE